MKIARTFAAGLAALSLAGAAEAALVDGSYEIDILSIDNSAILVTGSFDVVGGLIPTVSVKTDSTSLSGQPVNYSGSGTNGDSGATMFSAILKAGSSSTFFLNADGGFSCLGLGATAGCLVELTNSGPVTTTRAVTGTYALRLLPPSEVPLPASLPLAAAGMAGLWMAGRRRGDRARAL